MAFLLDARDRIPLVIDTASPEIAVTANSGQAAL